MVIPAIHIYTIMKVTQPYNGRGILYNSNHNGNKVSEYSCNGARMNTLKT